MLKRKSKLLFSAVSNQSQITKMSFLLLFRLKPIYMESDSNVDLNELRNDQQNKLILTWIEDQRCVNNKQINRLILIINQNVSRRMCAACLIAKERNMQRLNCLTKHSVIGYLGKEHKKD